MDNQNMPGSGAATASLVLGIVGVIVTFFINGLIGFILGIIGLAQASKAKREWYEFSIRTAGFFLSDISVVIGVIGLVACVACTAAGVGIGILGMM